MRFAPEISSVVVVLVGNFNPPIVRPDWLEKHGLFGAGIADAAEIEVIHPEVSIFRMDWASFQVQKSRFVVRMEEAPFVQLQDLLVRTFRELLPHTPIWAMGINRQVDFRVPDMRARDRIGTLLAPPEKWGEWGAQIRAEIDGVNDKLHGGMASLTMQQKKLDDRPNGYINAKIEPSSRLPATSGVFVEVNDHYEVGDRKENVDAFEIVNLLEANFEKSIERSEWIINQVMALV